VLLAFHVHLDPDQWRADGVEAPGDVIVDIESLPSAKSPIGSILFAMHIITSIHTHLARQGRYDGDQHAPCARGAQCREVEAQVVVQPCALVFPGQQAEGGDDDGRGDSQGLEDPAQHLGCVRWMMYRSRSGGEWVVRRSEVSTRPSTDMGEAVGE
jgi:hypothetical protein